ncbi:MAG: formimidoylglutamase [Bacteroidales bacterium]|jgi:arginase family enzyme|nr:formimidoylglutamase [Bacteroidales bacterium]
MEWSDFLDSVTICDEINVGGRSYADVMNIYREGERFPSLEDVNIALVGIGESRAALNNKNCAKAPDEVRKYFYRLFPNNDDVKIVDMGNIKLGFELADTYVAATAVISELLNRNIVPIIIGGSHDLAYANYLAYETLQQVINIVDVDPVFDIGNSEDDEDHRSYLTKIILHQPNYLFNLTNIGYQSYLLDQQKLKLFNNLFFDAYRLGVLTADIEEVEPIVRNVDMLSVDISAVRQSDAPANENALPNGFYGEQLCRIARYAGMSDRLTSFGIYEINPDFDVRGQTAHLAAQIIWYFIDGYYNRKDDFPSDDVNYLKYTVYSKNVSGDLVFYKSKKSDRWWMEIPCSEQLRERYLHQHMAPCSYKDYLTACQNDIPERLYRIYEKLM